jgi:alpha-tubulin suppressor-like RCC1 family protein
VRMAVNYRFQNTTQGWPSGVDLDDLYIRKDLFTEGTLWGMGYNNRGQLADNTSTNKSSPVQTVAGSTNWKQISVGYYHSAAIKSDGTLWMWGNNNNGQLGDNSILDKSSPVQTVAGGNDWKQVSTRFTHTVAIKTDGTMWAWGDNAWGQLGDNTSTKKSSPVQSVATGADWRQVSAGYRHSAGIKTDGTLWCWGNNAYGQLGDNSRTHTSSPIQTVAGGTNWKQVVAAGDCSSAIKTDGTLWTWGNNSSGELGDNTIAHKSSPIQTVAGGTNWKQVATGYNTTSAIKLDGTLWTWGGNTRGQLGDNSTVAKSSPVQTVMNTNNWKQTAGGGQTVIAVTNDF